jgi:limonene-1,2-epoxide hydrolase
VETPLKVEFVARRFVAAINAHGPDALLAQCTPAHVFVDSLGTHISGESRLRQTWEWYFAQFPNYRIDVEALASVGGCVLLCGWASATHVASKWRIPAAWRGIVEGERVSHWQVYADNKPVYEILNRGA